MQFYLIGKLEKEDEIKIYYNDIEYIYRIIDKKLLMLMILNI